MTVYADIQVILDAAVNNTDIGAHGRFWHVLSRDEFVIFKVFGQIPVLALDGNEKFDPDASNLIKALKGQSPFGKDQGVVGAKYRRMPAGRPSLSAPHIETVYNWIKSGCP
jgi:hypothetical protein